MPRSNFTIFHNFAWVDPKCVGEMIWNLTYSPKMVLLTIWNYYFGVLPTFTRNLAQKWAKIHDFSTLTMKNGFSRSFPFDGTYTRRRRIVWGIFWGMNRSCSPLWQKVSFKKRRKSRFYSWLFKNIRKMFSLFWMFLSVLSSCGVKIMIYTHPKNSQNCRNSV